MHIKCYCNLYTGDSIKYQKEKYILDLMNGELKHSVYIITLAQGSQNHLEFYAASLLKQHIYDDAEIFIVGIASKYWECTVLVNEIVQDVLSHTGGTDIRGYINKKQQEFEEGRR